MPFKRFECFNLVNTSFQRLDLAEKWCHLAVNDLYYKFFTIVIYDCNDIGLNYKTRDNHNLRS
jgi:hypothetical protein